ncbi:hypothetical protein J6590_089944 [Homalodisca vitripennis]|nr:hypothetical protein J6590_089944 [Homalodisca vitripennis]
MAAIVLSLETSVMLRSVTRNCIGYNGYRKITDQATSSVWVTACPAVGGDSEVRKPLVPRLC